MQTAVPEQLHGTGACDDVVLTQYDREERTIDVAVVLAAAADRTDSLCWEANVICRSRSATPAQSNILGSENI